MNEDDIEGFLERRVMPQGTSGKADIPRRYIGKRVYVIITKNLGTVLETGKRQKIIVSHTSLIQKCFNIIIACKIAFDYEGKNEGRFY